MLMTMSRSREQVNKAQRVKEMADKSNGGIENSLDCYRFLAHVFANMADRESRRKSPGLEIVQ